MKKAFFLIALSIIFVISCTKEENLINTKSVNNSKNNSMRLSTTMNDEEVETDINSFISKLEAPEGEAAMKIDEAMEYIEATLNYKYVNLDYSKCLSTVKFEGTQSIVLDSNGELSMSAIATLYSDIKDDWHNKYYSVEDEIKTPIAFDITSISDDNVVHYVMLVGHGSLYLEDYSDVNFTFPNNGNWISAADNMSWRMIAHLSNINIQENQRTYFVLTGSTYLGPKGPINTNDLIPSDGIIDYHRYYCEKSIHGNYFWLSTSEYDYHESMYFNDVAAFCNTVPNSTNISYSMVACDKTGDWFPNQNPPIYPTKAWHDPQVLYGVKHITTSNLSTL